MQLTELIPVLQMDYVAKNVFLIDILKPLEPEALVDKIKMLFNHCSLNGQHDDALKLLELVWPAILFARKNVPMTRSANKGHRGIRFDLSEKEYTYLDEALNEYGSWLERTLYGNHQIATVSDKVLSTIAYEMLCAGHLSIENKRSSQFFKNFTRIFIYDEWFRMNHREAAKSAPEILRNSLKFLPKETDVLLQKNLGRYLDLVHIFTQTPVHNMSEEETQVCRIVIIAFARLHKIEPMLQCLVEFISTDKDHP